MFCFCRYSFTSLSLCFSFPFFFHFPHFFLLAFSLFSLHPILCVPLLRQISFHGQIHPQKAQSVLTILPSCYSFSLSFTSFSETQSILSFIHPPDRQRERDREREQPQPIPSIWSTPKIYTKTKPPPTCPPPQTKKSKYGQNYNQLHSSNKGETTNKPK